MGKGSLRWRRRRANFCAGKAAFLSEEEAQELNPAQTAYHCPQCGSWHLTSAPMLSTGHKKDVRNKKRGSRWR